MESTNKIDSQKSQLQRASAQIDSLAVQNQYLVDSNKRLQAENKGIKLEMMKLNKIIYQLKDKDNQRILNNKSMNNCCCNQ